MPKTNIEIVNEWIDASNAHDPERIVALLHPDYVYDFGDKSLKGKEAVLAGWKLFLEAFPDLNYKVQLMLESGNHVISTERMTATQKGPLSFIGTDSFENPIPATNKRIDIPSCSIHKIQDGLIIHLTRFWDSATMLRQLGIHRI